MITRLNGIERRIENFCIFSHPTVLTGPVTRVSSLASFLTLFSASISHVTESMFEVWRLEVYVRQRLICASHILPVVVFVAEPFPIYKRVAALNKKVGRA